MRGTEHCLGMNLPIFLLGAFGLQASVSLSVSTEQLATRADTIAVVRPMERISRWEGDRIVTYVRVVSNRTVAGAPLPAEGAWVKTLGGRVGDLAQVVEGEPSFQGEAPRLAFLAKGAGKSMFVVARAQGIYALVEAKPNEWMIRAAQGTGELFAPSSLRGPLVIVSASQELANKSFEVVSVSLRNLWGAHHVTR